MGVALFVFAEVTLTGFAMGKKPHPLTPSHPPINLLPLTIVYHNTSVFALILLL
jgi:hypothetical protein